MCATSHSGVTTKQADSMSEGPVYCRIAEGGLLQPTCVDDLCLRLRRQSLCDRLVPLFRWELFVAVKAFTGGLGHGAQNVGHRNILVCNSRTCFFWIRKQSFCQ